MEKKRINMAVSELLGAIILLAIVTSVMALVFYQVSIDKGPYKQTFVKLLGKVEKTTFILENQGGDSLSLDTKISLTLAEKKYNYTVGDILDDKNHNGLWNIGERLLFPFTYDLNNLDKYSTIDLMSVDTDSNSIQFLGSVKLHPIVDLGVAIAVSNLNPLKNDFINVTLTLTCYGGGDINGSANIQVRYSIPQGLQYAGSNPELGVYDNTTGIWSIDKLIGERSVTLTIRLKVIGEGFREFTQFAMIMDGSGSIVPSDWNLMRHGLFKALTDDSVFPHDKSVELTVIQFGTWIDSYWGAEIVIPPTIINNETGTPGYFHTNAVTIQNLAQSRGNTPMACGIRLAADQLRTVGNYSNTRRQIVLMVTDGLANCNWIPGTYKGQYVDYGPGKTATEEAEAYLNTTLQMNPGQDEFDVFAVGNGPDMTWLNQSIVWPQPGHIAPPFIPGRGWVSKVTTWEEFSDRISEIFKLLFQSIPLKAEIISAFTLDPNSLNNMKTEVITPNT